MLTLVNNMTQASFYPDSLPDTAARSEREVLAALQNGLSEGWTVFPSVHWTNKTKSGKFHDGEADFVLYHPDFALLVLEVKGGGIEHDPKSGSWFTIPAGGSRKKLDKSPFRQARSNLYAILKFLRAHTGGEGMPGSWGHGVIFPAVTDLSGLVEKHPEAPSGLVAGKQDLPYLGEWCEQLAKGWIKAPPDRFADFKADPNKFERTDATPAPTITEFLRNTLCPPVSLPTELCLRQGLAREQQKIIELSANQCRVLSPLQRNRRLAVSGGAGTGKTFLALNKALTFARQGIPTLMTCYNRVLAESMAQAAERALRTSGDKWVLESEILTVATLTDYVSNLVDGGDLSPRMAAEQVAEREAKYWRELPSRYWKWRAKTNLPSESFIQALILDEGQDFGADWWHIIPTLMSDPAEDFIWTFYDNNQSIYAAGLGDDATGFLPNSVPVDLNENFRNTKEIYSAFQEYCDAGEQRALGPAGREPEIVELAAGEATSKVVGDLVKRLIEKEKLPAESIAVLTPTRNSSELFVEQLGGYATQSSGTIAAGKVVVETIHSFKGQESPVVILAEMHLAHPAQVNRLSYIAMSRAVSHLVVVS